MVLNFLQSLLVVALALWIVALGVSFMLQKSKPYLQWTWQTLRSIWQTGWKLIVGIAIGYYLAIEDSFRLSIN